jgi:hypothetical protein
MSVSDGKAEQYQCENANSESYPITPNPNVKGRLPKGACGIVLAITLFGVGLWLIQSAGWIEDKITVATIGRLLTGVLFIVVAWMIEHAALDLMELGKICTRNLLW